VDRCDQAPRCASAWESRPARRSPATPAPSRATYTCIGDTVNLAARLETHTKEAKRTILIDAATCASLDGRVPVEVLGTVLFRGKASPIEVFAVPWGQ
jgi:adenylate cyclase